MDLNLGAARTWKLPEPGITVIDAHTEGEPLRVILDGFPAPEGKTILARRRDLQKRYDMLRTAIMWEPRGHADMYGCLITPPISANADFGVLFMHNEGYSTMCGHGIIAVTKVVLETGMLPMHAPETPISIDTPAGLVTAFAQVSQDSVTSVRFQNVPSYAHALDQTVQVPGLGTVTYDIGFGGAYYAYVQAADHGLSCTPDSYSEIIHNGMAIKRAIMATNTIAHPYESDMGFLYGTIFVGPGEGSRAHSRNVCVFAEGEVDRSPTGTGVSGRAALHFARGEIGLNEPIEIESIIGSSFLVSVTEETTFGPHKAIIPMVEGRAYITGHNTFYLDPRDPYKDGFILR